MILIETWDTVAPYLFFYKLKRQQDVHISDESQNDFWILAGFRV